MLDDTSSIYFNWNDVPAFKTNLPAFVVVCLPCSVLLICFDTYQIWSSLLYTKDIFSCYLTI